MDTLTKLFDKRIQENIKLKRMIIEAANEKGFPCTDINDKL